MLSGISGMSMREKKKVGEMRSAMDTEHRSVGHIAEMNHFKLCAMAARWSGVDQEKQETKQKRG